MTAKEAMRMIVSDAACPALNYAVNYAKAGLLMDEESEEFRVQCLYLQGNLSRWRAGKTSKFSKEQIKEARAAIKIRNRKGGKIMSKAKIIVAHYDDRGDPYPPNNYRPEIIIGAKRLVDLDAFNCSHNGCMPKEKAIKIAKSWSKQTGVEYKD